MFLQQHAFLPLVMLFSQHSPGNQRADPLLERVELKLSRAESLCTKRHPKIGKNLRMCRKKINFQGDSLKFENNSEGPHETRENAILDETLRHS